MSRVDKRARAGAAIACWPQLSDRELARRAGVSHTYIAQIRRRLGSLGNIARPNDGEDAMLVAMASLPTPEDDKEGLIGGAADVAQPDRQGKSKEKAEVATLDRHQTGAKQARVSAARADLGRDDAPAAPHGAAAGPPNPRQDPHGRPRPRIMGVGRGRWSGSSAGQLLGGKKEVEIVSSNLPGIGAPGLLGALNEIRMRY